MADDAKQTISEKIEGAVEGILRFGGCLFRTFWVILRHPIRCGEYLIEKTDDVHYFSRPFTFLALGGFIFTLIISAYPLGFFNLLDLVWFDDEVSKIVYERWEEVLTISGLLTSAFPVLITVSLCSYMYGIAAISKDNRRNFSLLNCYLFGYQAFFIFSFLIFIIILGVVGEVLGFSEDGEPPIVGYSMLALWVMLFVSALFVPSLALTRWHYRCLRSEGDRRAAFALGITPLYTIAVLILYSYAASIPAAFKSLAEEAPPELAVHYIEDPEFRIRPAGGETHIADVSLVFALDNKPARNLIVEARDVSLSLVLEQDGTEDVAWFSDELAMQTNERVVRVVLVGAGEVKIFSLGGTIEIPAKAVEMMREKAAGTPQSNSFGFYIDLAFLIDGTEKSRRIVIDASEAVSDLDR